MNVITIMGPRGANRNYTYSKITHINSQEVNSWWLIEHVSYQLKLKLLPIYLIKINYFGCWIVKIRRSSTLLEDFFIKTCPNSYYIFILYSIYQFLWKVCERMCAICKWIFYIHIFSLMWDIFSNLKLVLKNKYVVSFPSFSDSLVSFVVID
jgi:hypothetical protein